MLFKVPCCTFSTTHRYTYNTLKHIQETTIEIFNDKMKNTLKPKQIHVFYSSEEIEDAYDISVFNTYNHSTLAATVDYNCK